MSLTGLPFLALTILAAVALTGLLVLFWARFARPGFRWVALRAAGLLAAYALVLLSAATALNDHYLFYASWSDLTVGSQQPVLGSVHTGAPPDTALRQRVPDAHRAGHPAALPPLPPGVNAAHRTFHVRVGGRSGVIADVAIALPRAYFAPDRGRQRFPVLEAFHGYPSTDRQWLRTIDLPGLLGSAVRRGRIVDAIVVAPTLQVPQGRDTECVNGPPGQPQLQDWLTRDVPRWVDEHLRADPSRTGWATIGLSSGGWCAALSAVTAPQRYAAAIVLGGYFEPLFSSWLPYPLGSPKWRSLDLVRRAGSNPPPVALWVQTSAADPVSLPSSLAFVRAARPPLSVQMVELAGAGHRIGVWEGQVPSALAWLGRTVPGFAPTAAR